MSGIIKGKDLAQLQQAVLDPAPPMFERASGLVILAVQDGAAHVPGDTMIVALLLLSTC